MSLRLVFRVSVCSLALFAFTAPLAHAGLISGVLPGLVSPADTRRRVAGALRVLARKRS